ncbi:FHA domain-containing protein [Pseudomonas sp. NPDC089752]|uniref:FHA domain-containing protein n=1 Tax=Pseudomonas sp. NPDC089752 TaxID=3364472 RepID=UPI0037FA2B33
MSTLTLSIINLDQVQHTVTLRHRFDRAGGTIGSEGASWVIDDRHHSVAPVHCEIRWIEGSYCVIDHCHRTFVNDGVDCLGSLPPRRLLEGDRLSIGAYRLLAQYTHEHADLRSLEDLFNPDNRVLDRLIADVPAQAWQHSSSGSEPATEICSIFEPGMGKDPMTAFDALADAAPSTVDPLQHLTAGERL